MKAPAWRIYYADGSTWSSLDGPVAQARRFGVVAVVYSDPTTGQCVASDGDYYALRNSTGRWTSHNLLGLHQLVAFHLDDLDAVLFGECIDDETYTRIKHAATCDADFPVAPVTP